MISITHTQVRSVVPTGFQTLDTITATVGIEDELYVFKTADDVFSRVATAVDVSTYPNNKPAAVLAGAPYYRANTLTVIYASVTTADEFAQSVIDRLKLLAVEYDTVTTDFVGTTIETITS